MAKILVGVVVCAVVAFLLLWNAQGSPNSLQNSARPMANPMKMKTVCVGRYLIDIPEGAIFAPGKAESDSVLIEKIELYPDENVFDNAMADFGNKLRGLPHSKEGTRLRSSSIMEQGKRALFVSRTAPDQTFLSSIEVFVNAGSAAWRLYAEVADEDVKDVTEEALEASASLTPRQPSDIPKTSGACVVSGLLTRIPFDRETFFAGA